MSNETTPARTRLDAWRRSGADRLDPMRFRFMEALERRAAAQDGETRRILETRLAGLLDAYAADIEHAGSASTAPATATEPARSALAALTDYLASAAPPRHAPYPELEALDYFRQTWSRVSTERQLRQSLAQVPGNAGPLNSSHLVHRSLSLMRELSPGYLQQFLSYVEALSWMEQMTAGSAPARDAPRASGARKAARARPR